ncbi:dysbindin protein homolog [Venturia canescens]|uniref:dysbindin protein homolog n=1 Tax=Venturia canescens TaxID=32260 RepID=UPI001C9C9EA2|nr:dysbindin protein homolog [Venturia canescens]
MFGTLRSKFQTVQDGISASIRGLTIAEGQNPKNRTRSSNNVSYDAGADVLHHFQVQWNQLHELAEDNASKALYVDNLVTGIYEKLDHEWNSITRLNATLASIPKINNEIQNLMDQIGTLAEAFDEVEAALFRLEDLNETLELQSRQLDHRFQLALYKEKKLSELDSTRAKLATQHSQRVMQQELKEQKILKERQETFEEFFQDELQDYKATGMIRQTPTAQQGPTLDKIILDTDTTEFDEFLNS